MPQTKVRPALQKIINEIEKSRLEAERTGWVEAYHALYQKLFAEPLPYKGRRIQSPYQHPDFAPGSNPVRTATADCITFYPDGGGHILRLGCHPPLGYNPGAKGPNRYFVFDLAYDDIRIDRRMTSKGEPTREVDIWAPPLHFALTLSEFHTEELFEHLIRQEVRTAYAFGGIFEPFCLADRWAELPEPMFWDVSVDWMDKDYIEQVVEQWKRLDESQAH